MKATKEMIAAGAEAARKYMEETGGNNLSVIWEAMWAARPKEPEQRSVSEHLEPVAWEISGKLTSLREVKGFVDTLVRDEEHNLRQLANTTPPQRKEPEQRSVSEHLEPVVLRFNEWTVGKNDLSDHIYIGELTLAGIEDNLEGPEFGEAEIERFDAVIEALQKKLVTGRECKKVPLIAYIGVNNATPPQRTWVGLDLDERTACYEASGGNLSKFADQIEAKLKEKNL